MFWWLHVTTEQLEAIEEDEAREWERSFASLLNLPSAANDPELPREETP